jgi:hypothetical protein
MYFADDGPKGSIPPRALDRLVTRYFSQYWPHEHFDALPLADYRSHENRREFQPYHEGYVIRYIDQYIQFLTEELSELEYEWVTANPTRRPALVPEFLVRLGNLLHAVEDYFFHSNFVEIRHWQSLKKRFPDLAQDLSAPEKLVAEHILEGTRYKLLPRAKQVRLQRLLIRRLRYPLFVGKERLSRESSLPAHELLYTGGFGETDIFHTVGVFLKGLEDMVLLLGSPLLSNTLSHSDLVLVRLLFSRNARKRMLRSSGGYGRWELNDAVVDRCIAEHRDDLKKERYEKWIGGASAVGAFTARTATELEDAVRLDRDMHGRYLFGPGGLMIRILAMAEAEHMNSGEVQDKLDGVDAVTITVRQQYSHGVQLPNWYPSDNLASAERIGTHSLLAKDSSDREPFRAEAVALAKHASASVALHLLRRITSRTWGTDWDKVLHHYLRAPRAGSHRWEEYLIRRLQTGTEPQPADVLRVPDQATYPDAAEQKFTERRSGGAAARSVHPGPSARTRLEKYYQLFEHPR